MRAFHLILFLFFQWITHIHAQYSELTISCQQHGSPCTQDKLLEKEDEEEQVESQYEKDQDSVFSDITVASDDFNEEEDNNIEKNSKKSKKEKKIKEPKESKKDKKQKFVLDTSAFTDEKYEKYDKKAKDYKTKNETQEVISKALKHQFWDGRKEGDQTIIGSSKKSKKGGERINKGGCSVNIFQKLTHFIPTPIKNICTELPQNLKLEKQTFEWLENNITQVGYFEFSNNSSNRQPSQYYPFKFILGECTTRVSWNISESDQGYEYGIFSYNLKHDIIDMECIQFGVSSQIEWNNHVQQTTYKSQNQLGFSFQQLFQIMNNNYDNKNNSHKEESNDNEQDIIIYTDIVDDDHQITKSRNSLKSGEYKNEYIIDGNVTIQFTSYSKSNTILEYIQEYEPQIDQFNNKNSSIVEYGYQSIKNKSESNAISYNNIILQDAGTSSQEIINYIKQVNTTTLSLSISTTDDEEIVVQDQLEAVQENTTDVQINNTTISPNDSQRREEDTSLKIRTDSIDNLQNEETILTDTQIKLDDVISQDSSTENQLNTQTVFQNITTSTIAYELSGEEKKWMKDVLQPNTNRDSQPITWKIAGSFDVQQEQEEGKESTKKKEKKDKKKKK